MAPSDLIGDLRAKAPLVHCITNYVAMNTAANVVLAAGASPAMVHAEEEVAEFTPICGALTINIGTLSAPWLKAMVGAAKAANAAGIPWVLDPVAHFITAFRSDAAAELLALKPAILRGNASEFWLWRARPGRARVLTAAIRWRPRMRRQRGWRNDRARLW